MNKEEAKKRIGQMLPVAQLALDRELSVLASHRARDRELQNQIAELDRQTRAGGHGPEDMAGGQIALWQEWRLQRRKKLIGERAAIRSDIEEATVAARRAFGRMEAARNIQKKLSE